MGTTTTAQVMDFDALNEYLTAVVEQYQQSAPQVSQWADGLYMRVFNAPETVVLTELIAALNLHADGAWAQANYVQIRIYKLLDRLGQDTTGWSNF